MLSKTFICCVAVVLSSYARAEPDTIERYLSLTASEKPTQIGSVSGFSSVFKDLHADNLEQNIRTAYAEELYFNDTFVTLSSRQELIEYLTKTQSKATTVKTTILDVARSEEDIYVRWLLEMEFEIVGRTRFSRSIGISHIRLDEHGQIVLHQDFWDSATGFYQYVPVVGGLMSWIRGKIED